MEIKILPLQTHGDERGSLVSLEEGLNVPFKIKRVYYLYDTKKVLRVGFMPTKTSLKSLWLYAARVGLYWMADWKKHRYSLIIQLKAY